MHFDLPSQPSVIDSPPPSTSAAPSSSASIPAGAQIGSRIQVGVPVEPRWFAADDRSLWVHEPTSLVRVDLATSAVTGQVPLDWMEYGYVTTGAGAVWQTDYENDALLRIDPVAGKVVASIPVGLQPLGVAVTAGAVWVADEHSEAVTRVDPATNRVVATIPIGAPGPAGPQIMTAGPGGVWVDVPNMGEVVRIDAATNKCRAAGAAGRLRWRATARRSGSPSTRDRRAAAGRPHRSGLGQGHHHGRPGYRPARRPGRRPRIRLGHRRTG